MALSDWVLALRKLRGVKSIVIDKSRITLTTKEGLTFIGHKKDAVKILKIYKGK